MHYIPTTNHNSYYPLGRSCLSLDVAHADIPSFCLSTDEYQRHKGSISFPDGSGRGWNHRGLLATLVGKLFTPFGKFVCR